MQVIAVLMVASWTIGSAWFVTNNIDFILHGEWPWMKALDKYTTQ